MNAVNTVNNIVNPNALRNNMKKFILDNGIIGTAAGVSIAIATKDVVQSFVNDIIMPSIYLLLITMNVPYFSKSLSSKHSVDFPHFINQFVSWIFITIITFLFVKIAFGSLFGVNEEGPVSPDKTATIAAIAVSSTSNK
jgi:large-conductance mechanosensitive channel